MVSLLISAVPVPGFRTKPKETARPSGPAACVISYSHTGNNDALAASVAAALDAEHRRVEECRPRTMGKIVLDTLLKRAPRVKCTLDSIESFDLVVFVAPVWMGQVASPLRACFDELKSRVPRYGFVSICGGAEGPNPGLAAELSRRLGAEPVSVVEMHIADLLPAEPRPERRDTMGYRISEDEVAGLAESVVEVFSGYATTRREK